MQLCNGLNVYKKKFPRYAAIVVGAYWTFKKLFWGNTKRCSYEEVSYEGKATSNENSE